MGRKKSSHGINIFSAIPWDGTSFKNFSSHPMGYHQKKFCPMGWDDFQKNVVPSHPIPWNHILLKYRFTVRIFAQLWIRLTVSIILLLCVASVPDRALSQTGDRCLLEIFFSFCEMRSKRSVAIYKGRNLDPALVPHLLSQSFVIGA